MNTKDDAATKFTALEPGSFSPEAEGHLVEFYAQFGSTTIAQKMHALGTELRGPRNFSHDISEEKKLQHLELEFLEGRGLFKPILA